MFEYRIKTISCVKRLHEEEKRIAESNTPFGNDYDDGDNNK